MEAKAQILSENKIVKRDNFFRRYFYLLFGSLFLVLGGFDLLQEEWNFMFVGYFLIGAGYFSLHFYYKKKNGTNESYIAWDNEKIIVRELPQPPSIYTWDKVDNVRVSNNHITIKSGAANGMMMDLKGYKKEDVEQLKSMAVNFQK